MNLTLKVKTKTAEHIVNNFKNSDSISSLQAKLSELTNISIDRLSILIGFPPKLLTFTDITATLQACGITNGDKLIVEEKTKDEISGSGAAGGGGGGAPAATAASNKLENKSLNSDAALAEQLSNANDPELGSSNGILLKKVVPSDNSCLFTSMGYLLNGKINTENKHMRELIASEIEKDPETYSEAILGKTTVEYCDWIKKTHSWGGAIEVSVLSNMYGIEIAVVDIVNATIIYFGEDKSYGTRVFLLFDGIHYDPLYLESNDGEIKTLFQSEDKAVLEQAQLLATEAKSSRQFTDLEKFLLKCNVCSESFKGQTEAQQHAKITGHADFGEI